MATSPDSSPPPPLNAALVAVTAHAVTELDPVWQLNPADVGPALFDVLPALLEKWTTASASVAADWYDELRTATNIKGRFTAFLKPLPDLGAEALAGWGAEPLKVPQPEPDLTAVRDRVEGGVQKRLVNAANLTVTESADQDPQARGWMRKTRPGACGFCRMVASRGGVFTKATATFACHERCYCQAIPAWGGEALPVGPYKPSDKPSTAADRARVRKWIRDNIG